MVHTGTAGTRTFREICETHHSDFEAVVTLANIQLIAAAPDLYATLKELVRVVDGTLQGYGILEAPVQCARTALAKARGETV